MVAAPDLTDVHVEGIFSFAYRDLPDLVSEDEEVDIKRAADVRYFNVEDLQVIAKILGRLLETAIGDDREEPRLAPG